MPASQVVGTTGPAAAAEEAARILGIDVPRVFVLDGVPHLEGTVPSFRHKKAAAELIGLLTGAPHVMNRLRVAPRQGLSDRAIHRRLQAAFREAPAVDATIEPEVKNAEEQAHVLAS